MQHKTWAWKSDAIIRNLTARTVDVSSSLYCSITSFQARLYSPLTKVQLTAMRSASVYSNKPQCLGRVLLLCTYVNSSVHVVTSQQIWVAQSWKIVCISGMTFPFIIKKWKRTKLASTLACNKTQQFKQTGIMHNILMEP